MARRKRNNGRGRNQPGSASLASGAAPGRNQASNVLSRSGMPAPMSLGYQVRNAGPKFTTNGKSMCITHREFVRSVTVTGLPFQVSQAFALNPGRYTPFPWLHELARKFESYTFRALRFVYVPSCSASTDGSVSMMIDYDAADAPPVNKEDVLGSFGAVRTAAWQSATLVADPEYLALGGLRRFTRGGKVPDGKDIKTYDAGNFFFALDGFGALATVGDIFVEYTVELFVPQMSALEELEDSAKIIASGNAGQAKLVPFGDASTSVVSGLLDLVTAGDKLYFKEPGEYLVDLDLTCTGATADPPNCVLSTCQNETSFSQTANAAGTAGRSWVKAKVTEPDQYLSITYPNIATIAQLVARVSKHAFAL